jgi:hypothetical protein
MVSWIMGTSWVQPTAAGFPHRLKPNQRLLGREHKVGDIERIACKKTMNHECQCFGCGGSRTKNHHQNQGFNSCNRQQIGSKNIKQSPNMDGNHEKSGSIIDPSNSSDSSNLDH